MPNKAVKPPLKTAKGIFGYIGTVLGWKNATGAVFSKTGKSGLGVGSVSVWNLRWYAGTLPVYQSGFATLTAANRLCVSAPFLCLSYMRWVEASATTT